MMFLAYFLKTQLKKYANITLGVPVFESKATCPWLSDATIELRDYVILFSTCEDKFDRKLVRPKRARDKFY
jgi:hypothetical protein